MILINTDMDPHFITGKYEFSLIHDLLYYININQKPDFPPLPSFLVSIENHGHISFLKKQTLKQHSFGD